MEQNEIEAKYVSTETQTEEKIFEEKSTQTIEVKRKNSSTPTKKQTTTPTSYRRTPRKNYKEESSDEERDREDHSYFPNKKKQKVSYYC